MSTPIPSAAEALLARARGHAREARDGARRAATTVELAVRVGHKTGLLPRTLGRGLLVLTHALVRGRTSPSTLYRVQAASQPHKLALRWRDGAYTFRQLDTEIDRLATGLRAMGLGRGSRAVLMLKNRPEFIVAQPAMSRIGGAGVCVSWRSTARELALLVNHSGAEALLFEHDVADVVRHALADFERLRRDRIVAVGGRAGDFPSYEQLVASPPDRAPDEGEEAGVIIYTSGTTGRPKGAERRFPRDVVPGALHVILASPIVTDDVHLSVLPFYHSTAFAFTSFSHLIGASVVILEQFDPEQFLRAVEQHRVTQTALVPTLLHRVLKLGPERILSFDTRSLRAVMTAGAPLGARLAADFMDVFGDILFNFYGATETGLNTMATPADLRASPGTIGRLLPGSEIRLLDDSGDPVAAGQVGELYARSGLMVTGYLGDEAATRACQRDGFFSVGDLGWLDAGGCYHLAGRKRDMIISGGVNVYPAEVEQVIESHPAVAEAAVVGVPDEEWGERVRAFVVLRDPARGQEAVASIEEHCREQLMGPKRPREYVLIEALPRNPTGKVLKRELRCTSRPPTRSS
jgi:fatty-acyl-CoA synthase